MTKNEDDRIISGELAKLPEKSKEAAGEILAQWQQFKPLLPAFARGNEKQLLLSAVKYIRRHIDGPFDGGSFVDAVFDAAQFGLAIDGTLAHALPFDDKKNTKAKTLVFVPDYKGLVAVAKWREFVRDIRAYAVYDADIFEPPRETPTGVEWSYQEHVGPDRGECIGAIAIFEFPDDRPRHIEWMTRKELDLVQQSAKTQKIWSKWTDEMRKKTVIRRAFKMRRFDSMFSSLVDRELDGEGDEEVIEMRDGKPVVEKKKAPARARAREVRPEPREPEARVKEPEAEPAADEEPVADARSALWSEYQGHKDAAQFTDDEYDEIREAAGVDLLSKSCGVDALEAAVQKAEEIRARRKR